MSKSKRMDDLLSGSSPLNRASRLAGVLETVSSTRALEGAMVVPIATVNPNFFQARQEFDQEALAELAADIRERGILEPLIVRELEPGQYQIIAGERRYLAAHQAGLTELPVIVRQMDDRQARFATLAENLQRQDLSPSDEQRFFQMLQAEYNLSIRDIARMINKSKGYVENRLEGKLQELAERPSQGQTLQVSQTSEGNVTRITSLSSTAVARRYNPAVYKRVTQFWETALETVKSQPDPDTLKQIREQVADAEIKLAYLKKELDKAE